MENGTGLPSPEVAFHLSSVLFARDDLGLTGPEEAKPSHCLRAKRKVFPRGTHPSTEDHVQLSMTGAGREEAVVSKGQGT